MNWILLILSLPTETATARMRSWRALKASGAAVLRDGVYLLPAREDCRTTLTAIADAVRENGGSAYVLNADGEGHEGFPALFDRASEFGGLLADIAQRRTSLTDDNALDTLKHARKLRKAFAQLAAIDFFPGEAQKQTDAALQALEMEVSRILSPDEPHPVLGVIPKHSLADYRGRVWATRARPWVDRLASAWLIRRFIDREARILWLASPADGPAEAVGFDFDGATLGSW